MKSSHAKNIIHGSATIVTINIIAGGLNYFVRRTLAINLSVTDFGFLYAAMSLCMLFLSYLDLGLSGSATILIARAHACNDQESANSYFNYIFYFKLIISLLIFIIIAVTYRFWLNSFFKYEHVAPFFIIISLIIIQAISGVPGCALIALQKFFLQSMQTFLIPLILLIIFFIFGSNNIIIAGSAFPISAFSIFLLTYFIVHKFGFRLNFKSLKNIQLARNMFHISKWIAISTAGYTSLYYMDSLMLTYLSGLKAVGIYNIVLSLVQLANSFLIFHVVFIPIATRLWIKKEIHEIANICNIMTLITSYLIWPIAIVIIFSSKSLITILFSVKYIEGSNALIILFIGIVILGLANFYTAVLNTGGKEKKVAILLMLAFVLNVILNITLIPIYNTAGAAAATTITYFILSLLLFVQLKKTIRQIRFPLAKTLYFSVAGMVCLSLSFYLETTFHQSLSTLTLFLFFTLGLYIISTFLLIKSTLLDILNSWKNKK